MRISLKQFLADRGYKSAEEYIAANESELLDSVVPALCSHECGVEPDGHCEHGAPSVLLALGVI